MRHGLAVLSNAVFVLLLAAGAVDGQSSASPRRDLSPRIQDLSSYTSAHQVLPGVGLLIMNGGAAHLFAVLFLAKGGAGFRWQNLGLAGAPPGPFRLLN